MANKYAKFEDDDELGELSGNDEQTPSLISSFCSLNTAFDVFGDLKREPKVKSKDPSVLNGMSVNLVKTYSRCSTSFQYSGRRCLSSPSKPMGNDGCDNENADLILHVNDILGVSVGRRYLVLDLLGKGTFGQVVKCHDLDATGRGLCAVKIVKNKPAYSNQAVHELRLLQSLGQSYDLEEKCIIKKLNHFIHRNHLCIVTELLSVNLYELLKHNQYRGLSTRLIHMFMTQLVKALKTLYENRIIHCDIKPENILLKSLSSPTIKLIDFGSACMENMRIFQYIQSRFYRSPEVLLGLSYDTKIDMWSLGCICAELFLGLPLLPGASEHNQLHLIDKMRGPIPDHMITGDAKKFFNEKENGDGSTSYTLKSADEYAEETGTEVIIPRKYFAYDTIEELIDKYPYRKGLSKEEIKKEKITRLSLTDFISGLVQIDPKKRWNALQASLHPFITGQPFVGPFSPPDVGHASTPIHAPLPVPHVPMTATQFETPMASSDPGRGKFTPAMDVLLSVPTPRSTYDPHTTHVAFDPQAQIQMPQPNAQFPYPMNYPQGLIPGAMNFLPMQQGSFPPQPVPQVLPHPQNLQPVQPAALFSPPTRPMAPLLVQTNSNTSMVAQIEEPMSTFGLSNQRRRRWSVANSHFDRLAYLPTNMQVQPDNFDSDTHSRHTTDDFSSPRSTHWDPYFAEEGSEVDSQADSDRSGVALVSKKTKSNTNSPAAWRRISDLASHGQIFHKNTMQQTQAYTVPYSQVPVNAVPRTPEGLPITSTRRGSQPFLVAGARSLSGSPQISQFQSSLSRERSRSYHTRQKRHSGQSFAVKAVQQSREMLQRSVSQNDVLKDYPTPQSHTTSQSIPSINNGTSGPSVNI